MCPRHARSITRFCSGSKQNELRVSTYVENKLSPLPDKAEFEVRGAKSEVRSVKFRGRSPAIIYFVPPTSYFVLLAERQILFFSADKVRPGAGLAQLRVCRACSYTLHHPGHVLPQEAQGLGSFGIHLHLPRAHAIYHIPVK